MKQKLFQVAVLLHTYEETEKEGRKYKSSQIVIDPKFVLGKDQKEVLFKITREIPDEFATNPDDIEILVRDF